MYVDKALVSKKILYCSTFQEYVIVNIQGDNEQILICNIYRSPHSSIDKDKLMFDLINCLSKEACDKMLLLGDFNLDDINWDTFQANSSLSKDFVEVLRDNFLSQYVRFPTRARGSDTPRVLDLYGYIN